MIFYVVITESALTKLNQVAKSDTYILPLVDDLFTKLPGGFKFTNLVQTCISPFARRRQRQHLVLWHSTVSKL